jgi:uncharacterized protein (TIGR02594 family)
MMRILLAVIVAMCAFATPSLADPNVWPQQLQEGRSSLDAGSDDASEAADRDEVREADNDRSEDRDRAKGAKRLRVKDRNHARHDRDDDDFGGSSGSRALAIAQKYIGTNPTKMRRLWCANFLGMIEKKAGRSGSGSNFARSYADYGKKVSRHDAKPGDIVVMSRGKRGGHVGYFAGWADNGKAIVISGNSRGGKVSKGQYAASRIFAWRRPA